MGTHTTKCKSDLSFSSELIFFCPQAALDGLQRATLKNITLVFVDPPPNHLGSSINDSKGIQYSSSYICLLAVLFYEILCLLSIYTRIIIYLENKKQCKKVEKGIENVLRFLIILFLVQIQLSLRNNDSGWNQKICDESQFVTPPFPNRLIVLGVWLLWKWIEWWNNQVNVWNKEKKWNEYPRCHGSTCF